jgi:phage terminase small subunit
MHTKADWMDRMPVLKNVKHEAVAQAYIADPAKVGWRAYKAVYPKSSQHAAETAFGRLLKNAEFSSRIAEMSAEAAEGAVATAREVLEQLTKIGFANIQDYVRIGPDGDPVLDFENLTRDQAAALQEVTVETYMEGRGKNAREVKKVRFKLADKRAALVDLGRHHKLFTNKFEHGGKDGRPIEGKITIEFVKPPKRKDERSPRTRGRGST